MSNLMTHRHRAPGFIGSLPAGGLRSVMPGGNTIGGWCREERPRADGFRHVDTQRMIERLLEVGANHFFFGIWDSPTDFDDLCVEFAPAAERAGLLLTPYIVPPSETFEFGRASEPYRTDYLAWAEAMAELSLRCPAVTSWAIDDFDIGANGDTFTPEHLAAIRERAASINPDLALLTCAYFGSATSEAFLARYGPYVDGIILPFLDGPNSNTVVAESLADTIGQVLAATQDHGLGVLTLIYA
ncbi:MAG: hypothetical protein L0G99_16900, partial [Propionibacteriales bacterium]|nr:hypothetical protein [Propionibacteriales bacterium]